MKTVTGKGLPRRVLCGDISRSELAEAARATGAAVFTEGLLRAMSLPRACRWAGLNLLDETTVDVGDATAEPPPGFLLRVDAVYRAVHRTYTHLPLTDTCLRRALTAGYLLREFHPVLVMGVRRDPSRASLQAHAWLRVGTLTLDWSEQHHAYRTLR